MTKLTKKLLASGVAASIALPFAALAQVDLGGDEAQLPGAFNLASNQTDLRSAIINVVQYILGFLGLIAVIIILYGGFLWMTAAGNEEKVGKAKQTITAGLIGLIIILSAWAIAAFVINALQTSVFTG
jgi:hypothetical protein